MAFRTLGCKVNQTDSEVMADSLLAGGWRVAPESDAAVVVVNSCTVTAEADRKARKAVRRALALPSRPVVVVTGCLAAVDAEGLAALGDRVLVEPRREVVASRLGALGHASPGAVPATGVLGRTRAMVKVQDGCDRGCAYCIVPRARGAPRSVRAAEVTSRVRALARVGVAEVVVTGIDVGRYRDGELRLPDLLREVALCGVARIRLSSIEPPDLSEELLGVLASSDRFAPHLHVPLQSGSDGVLAAMHRGYDTAAYERAVDLAREALPGLALTTDVLVGFPGEREEDFEATRAFVRRMAFSRLHVFRYSRRAGTPAAVREDQVSGPVKTARARSMRALDAEARAAHRFLRRGGTADVLVERVGAGWAEGTSEDYLRVRVNTSTAAEGDTVRVVLSGEDGGVMRAEPLQG